MEEKINISLTSEQIIRFYNNVKIDEQTGCHIYIGGKNKTGYGVMKIGHKQIRAHRIAWYLNNGKILNELCVLHKCDNRICVNPDHLFLGTQIDNIKDMVNKGRNSGCFGETSHTAKLKEIQVIDILNIVKQKGQYYGLIKELSEIYNVNWQIIRNIIKRKTWKYLKVE
jgi:hypothetical protein